MKNKQDQWVKPFLKKYKGAMILAIFFSVMTVVCASALMFTSGFLISKAASRPENILLIYVPIVLTRAFGIGRPVFRYAQQLTSHNWVLKIVSSLRLKLYRSLEEDAIFLKKHQKLGDLLSVITEDINNLQNLYLTTIFPCITAWLIYAVVIIGLGLFSWWFALMMLLVFLVLLVIFPLCSVIINGAKIEKQKHQTTELYNNLTDNVLGISDWIFSQQSQSYLDYHKNAQNKLVAEKNKLSHDHSIRNVLFQGVIMIITLITIVWAAFRFQGNHGGAANWIAAFVLCIFPLADAFRPLSGAIEDTVVYKDSIQRLNDLPQAKDQNKQSIKLEGPLKIEIKDLKFNYEDDTRVVLDNINLKIDHHEKIAILGKSGSGKSTLLNLLRGDLKPTAGSIKINGVDVADFGDEISDYIGVIDQNPYLFNTSILNNIRMGKETATQEEVWDTLKKVKLDQLVASLPDGIRTNVTEAGQRFSGGERQRLALARIILKNPPIIILDEPTVGLDPLTEQNVLNTFFNELKDNTIIWVTHHLQGIDQVDQVIFIENGQITLEGTPSRLSQSSQHFRDLKQMDAGFLD